MFKENLKSIIKILADAGEAILEIYERDDFQMELKSDNSPVTIADRKSGEIINNGLLQLFPDIPIINEENKIAAYKERKSWTHYFLIDPLDGTKEFINRNGEFCINLALMERTKPVEAFIYQPLEKKGWFCKEGEGIVTFDDKGKIYGVEEQKEKSSKIRIVASRSFFKPREAELIQKIEETYPIEIIHRGSSLKQIDIICGNADMYMKAGPCSEWDTAPGQLMIEEFGGAVLLHSNFQPMRYNKTEMKNPYFVMLNSRLNNPKFIQFLKQIILD